MKQTQHIQSVTAKVLAKLTSMSYSSLFLLWIGMALGFSLAYFILSSIAPSHAPTQIATDPTLKMMLLDSIYYSIITATSTGYGDITPQGFSKILACVQSILALFVFAVFVTKLVSNKQEIALQQVHKLAFEDVFHNVREGLYIVRKDFHAIIHSIQDTGSITNRDWRNLTAAYEQIQSLFAEIPSFYESENDFYTIDERREILLQEGVYRTLDRLNELLNEMARYNLDWEQDTQSFKELLALTKQIKLVTPLWQQHSPYQHQEAFVDIIAIHMQIETKVIKIVEAT